MMTNYLVVASNIEMEQVRVPESPAIRGEGGRSNERRKDERKRGKEGKKRNERGERMNGWIKGKK